MKTSLFEDRLHALRKRVEPFIKSYGLSWDDLRKFSENHGLGKKHTIYQDEFIGLPFICTHPLYEKVIKQKKIKILDNGCGLGINTRFLLFDGLQKNQIKASELDQKSLDLGFELFRDRNILDDIFVKSDAKEISNTFSKNSFTVIYNGFLLHQFKTENDLRIVLEENKKILAHNGEYFGMTRGTYKQKKFDFVNLDAGKTRFLVSKEFLAELLANCGYKNIWIEETTIDDEDQECVIFYYARI